MTAQHKEVGGRHFVNEDFVDKVTELYPGTSAKIPLGWRVYTGWQGKDEVLFVEHDPVEPLEGRTFEVSYPPDNPDAFLKDILSNINSRKEARMERQRLSWTLAAQAQTIESLGRSLTPKAKKILDRWLKANPRLKAVEYPLALLAITSEKKGLMMKDPKDALEEYCYYIGYENTSQTRVPGWVSDLSSTLRVDWKKQLAAGAEDRGKSSFRSAGEAPVTPKKATLEMGWGETLQQTFQRRQAARQPSGLYGYTKSIQASCEASVRKLNKRAGALVRKAAMKDPRVLEFLQVHAKRAKSQPAKVLLACYKDSLPKIASNKTAKYYGMYGFPAKTASTGVSMCSALREAAGIISAELHARKTADYESVTGFFTQHGKTAKCGASKLLLSVYPDSTVSFGKTAATHPQTVDEWLAWEPE